jgi:hypothetical protein
MPRSDRKENKVMAGELRSVCISDKDVQVRFNSNNDRELAAIKDCFEYFWTIQKSSKSSMMWSIRSCQVTCISDIMHPRNFSEPGALFKEVSVRKYVVGRTHYYSHELQGVPCLTCFDLEAKTTHFYHEAEVTDHSYIRNLVREPIIAQYEKAGYVAMHASSCTIEGKGILMPGLKGAGKSTLLSHMLEGGAQFIGNDAVLCRRRAGTITLTPAPQCVRLSRETIRNNIPLIRYFEDGGSYSFILGKYEFLPNVFDDVFPGHRLSVDAKLDLVLLPSLDLTITDYALEEGDSKTDLEILEQSLFYPYHRYVWSPFFAELNEPLFDLANFSAAFTVPPRVYRLKYGILDDAKRKALFSDIADVVATT